MPNGGQFGGVRLPSRAQTGFPAPSTSVWRGIVAAASLSYRQKCEVYFAIALEPWAIPETHRPERWLFRQIAQIIVAGPIVAANQLGTVAVSASAVRAATIFCIIVMNRFCSALLRPSSVS
jgi:hypothetical protein